MNYKVNREETKRTILEKKPEFHEVKDMGENVTLLVTTCTDDITRNVIVINEDSISYGIQKLNEQMVFETHILAIPADLLLMVIFDEIK